MVIAQIVDKTTTQINLLDINDEPTETNINLTFYNTLSGKTKHNYVHKINSKGNPDTMVIDHLISYKIIAHTIPPVIIDSVHILHAEHNIIGIKTPQGKLEIKMKSRTPFNCIIRTEESDSILHVQEINTIEEYIVGNYSLETLTIPRIKKNIRIDQNKTTEVTVPTPAIMNISLSSKGFGGVYLYNTKKKEWNQVFHFRNNQRQYKLTVLPGQYKVVYRANTAKGYIYTKENKAFILKEGDRKYIKF
jgi:Ca-activated chloride channel family protein